MPGIEVEVEVEEPLWTDALADAAGRVRAAAAAAVHADAARAGIRGDVEIGVLLAGDARVRELNARFRGRDAATNVLSFPAPESARPHLGDVALAFGVCSREAAEQGKPLSDHLSHLVVHGALHLLGRDHHEEAEAEEMEALERAVLEGLGVPDPYGERVHGLG